MDKKLFVARQFNIDADRIVDVKKTWKNWVVTMETCGTGDDLVLVIPHDKIYDIDRLSTAINHFAI